MKERDRHLDLAQAGNRQQGAVFGRPGRPPKAPPVAEESAVFQPFDTEGGLAESAPTVFRLADSQSVDKAMPIRL